MKTKKIRRRTGTNCVVIVEEWSNDHGLVTFDEAQRIQRSNTAGRWGFPSDEDFQQAREVNLSGFERNCSYWSLCNVGMTNVRPDNGMKGHVGTHGTHHFRMIRRRFLASSVIPPRAIIEKIEFVPKTSKPTKRK